MLKTRIIPCLDVIKNKVVKGVNFKNIKVMGNAVDMAKFYSEAGADELCMLDINASYQNRKTFIKTVESIARVINIPLTVGGGISDLSDITNLLNAGADKVSINSAAVKNPNLVKKASSVHGSQCIVVAIDAKRSSKGWNVYINGGRVDTGIDAVKWAKKAEDLGAGEILLTSMDRDGTKSGFDIELTSTISECLKIPVIASGGVGSLDHFLKGVTLGGASAVLAASVFHFKEITIEEVKKHLKSKGVNVRIDNYN